MSEKAHNAATLETPIMKNRNKITAKTLDELPNTRLISREEVMERFPKGGLPIPKDTDDEKAAEEYATSCFDGEDYDGPSQTKLERIFLNCIQETRKGYIKADKAIEVVAETIYNLWKTIDKYEYTEGLPEKELAIKRAKEELGIE